MTTRWRSRRPRLRNLAGATFLALIIFGAITARLFVWPDLQPLPPRVDAVIELGGPGDRDRVVLALAQQQRSPVVIQSTFGADVGTDRCLPSNPGVRVLCFHADPPTTRGEAQYIGQMAAQHNWRSVALVTTPDQAWRARLRVTRCFDGAVYVATAPLPGGDWFYWIPYQWAAITKALVFERDC